MSIRLHAVKKNFGDPPTEVIRGVEKIAALRGESVDEIKRVLEETYRSQIPPPDAPGTSAAPPPPAAGSNDPANV